MEQELNEVIDAINELIQDESTHKSVKQHLTAVIEILLKSDDLSVRIHKAMLKLEEISENKNIESFTRSSVLTTR